MHMMREKTEMDFRLLRIIGEVRERGKKGF